MEVVIEGKKDFVNQTIQAISSHQRDNMNLFEELMNMSEKLTDNSLSDSEKLDVATSCEYMIFKLRVQLTYEQQSIKSLSLSQNNSVPTQVSLLFKQRDTVIASAIQRLNELRDDISVVQKLLWVKQHSTYLKS